MLAMLNPGPGWLEDAEEESDCEKATAVIHSIMASSRPNLRMRNHSFGNASTTTAEILSPPFQMSKQPTRTIFALSSELGTSSLGSSLSRASGQCLRECSMSGARAIHEFRHRAGSARVADLHLALLVHVAVPSRY